MMRPTMQGGPHAIPLQWHTLSGCLATQVHVYPRLRHL